MKTILAVAGTASLLTIAAPACAARYAFTTGGESADPHTARISG